MSVAGEEARTMEFLLRGDELCMKDGQKLECVGRLDQ
jgi:hypothetical protein